MALLTYPKSDYLLNASIESLHIESREWLAETNFWRDEIVFLEKLIHKREITKNIPSHEIAGMEKELINISVDKLERIRNEVQSHEVALAALYKTDALQEEEKYRQNHRALLIEIYDFYRQIRDFKKNVFSVIQQYE